MQRIARVASVAWHGLIQVLAGSAPAAAWHWRSQAERRAAYAAVAVATLALCWVNVTHVHPVAAPDIQPPASPWQLFVALVVVLPLPLAARYPMLAWRAGWVGLLLPPFLPAGWGGGRGVRRRSSHYSRRSAWPGSANSGRRCAGCGR